MKIYRVEQMDGLQKVDDQLCLAIRTHARWRSDVYMLEGRYFSSITTMLSDRTILGDSFHANRRLITANTYL